MFYKITTGVLHKIHFKNVKRQHWDLTKKTRLALHIYLN